MRKILLMGNPNVGKSVIFSQLTGVHTTISNYPGTTVEYAKGCMILGSEKVEVIDVPGTYSMSPSSTAEDVATQMVKDGDIIINVVDATNLERNLNLTLQLAELGKPLVVALNMWDETTHKGIEIDIERLSQCLKIPVIPTVAISGSGIKELAETLQNLPQAQGVTQTEDERWRQIGEIASHTQKLHHHHHTLLERIEDVMVGRVSGVIMAAAILVLTFFTTRFMGEGLINYIFDPFFNNLIAPLLIKLSSLLGPGTFLHDILIGRLVDGQIHFKESMGILSTGLYLYPAAVLPYILSFYLVLGILEDIGYLPRVAVLMDNLMHRMGLHGYAIIPNILGLGCNVPGIMATRVLESTRERFIAATIISIAVPCAALQAMIIGVLGGRGIRYVLMVYVILFVTWSILGLVLNRLAKGFSPPLFIEIPPLRWPEPKIFFKKYKMRIFYFMKEAFPILIGGIAIAAIFYATGIFEYAADFTAPLIHGIWGLPKDAVAAIAIGFLRKDVAVGMLEPLRLSTAELVTACTVLSIFFPCVASFIILLRELKWKLMLASTGIMLFVAVAVGGIVNLLTKQLLTT